MKKKSPHGKKYVKPKHEVKNMSPKRCALKHIDSCEEYPKKFLYNMSKLCESAVIEKNQPEPKRDKPISRMNKPELCKYIKTNPILIDSSFKKLKEIRKQVEGIDKENIPPIYREYFENEYEYLGGRLGGELSTLYLLHRLKKSKNVDLLSRRKTSLLLWSTDLEKEESYIKVDSNKLTKLIVNYKKRYTAFFITLERIDDSKHSNLIIIDNTYKRAYLYDPSSAKHYGRYNISELNDILDIYFKKIGYKYISTWEYCPVFSISQWFQTQMKALKKKKNVLDPPGFCSVHTLLILDLFSKQTELSFEDFIKTINKYTAVSVYDLVYRFHSFVTHSVLKYVRKIGYTDEYEQRKVNSFIKNNRSKLFK